VVITGATSDGSPHFSITSFPVHSCFFKYYLIAVASFFFLSCTPEEIEFPDEQEIDPTAFSQSNGITGLFNEINEGQISLDDLCFQFQYPLSFKTASEVILEVEDDDGLNDLISSQTSGFFVNQISFPITISLNGEKEISNEVEFQEVLESCGIAPLPFLISIFHEECVSFEYPLSISLDMSTSSEISSFEALTSEFDNQEDFFLLDISYPIETTSGQSILNDFELYQALNNCQYCPSISFSEVAEGNDLILEASIERIEEIGRFKWYIDNELIEEDGPAVSGDFLLNATSAIGAPGTFEVCLFAEYEYCDSMLSFCKEITIDERCPENFAFETFQTAQDDDSVFYTFEMRTLSLTEDAEVKWYINDELIQSQTADELPQLQRAFANGTYVVCARYFSDFCLQDVEFCQSLEVAIPDDDPCPKLSFFIEGNVDNTYFFVADFEGIETLEFYAWSVDGSFVEQENPAGGSDNLLEFTFNEPGIHTVCIFTETPDCPSGAEFCLEVDTR